MNTLTAQLAEQAAQESAGLDNETNLEVTFEDTSYTVPATFIEKFAELIVAECIRVPYDMWDKAELNADIAVKIEHRIKEHFGVE